MEEKIKQKRGRKPLDKGTLTFTLDKELIALIQQYPEGERSIEVNKRLRLSFGLSEKPRVEASHD